MANDKLAALGQLGLVQNDALHILIDHVRALALTNTALVAALGKEGRAAVRDDALAGLGMGPGNERAAALIVAFTGGPAADHQAAVAGAQASARERLQ